MRAIAPLHVIEICQFQIRLVDERRRLERVAGTLALHIVVREAPELSVDDWHESIARGWIAIRPRREEPRKLFTL
jgi:hypothetical protein